MKFKLFLVLWCFISVKIFAQSEARKDIPLNSNWLTVADELNKDAYNGFEKAGYPVKNWKKVNVPHNWDQYDGYRRKLHGNKHGYAWYLRTFKLNSGGAGKKYFLYFEGVGSYATIWLNGIKVGYHAGGRTTFTLDVSRAIKLGNQPNLLAVKADHPPNIRDLPWVDGGCSAERGFSEGSQPMGIFRPVHLIVTNNVRIQPFGLHVWNNEEASGRSAVLHLETTLKNYSRKQQNITIVNQLLNREGRLIKEIKNSQKILAGQEISIAQNLINLTNLNLWSLKDPYLYTIKTILIADGKVKDQLTTPYGIRIISWPIGTAKGRQFLLNGEPVFINGVAEYEHLIGNSHAFTGEQILARVKQIKFAGFNAFRDAHQPHNLEYQQYWDRLGVLSWTQMAAHIWYDTPEFRENFKSLLTDWIKERRNSPSVVLWGLENESTLPEDFAKECAALIRKLDPTASGQRKITTCNGGQGTDWDVPQNWTGTYGGNPLTYAEDLKKQVLVGEYGAWRSIDLHDDDPSGGYSENHMAELMETKIRLADSVRNEVAGHFFWLYNSHDNPGRVQGGEGLRDLDRIGPVNYKGMFTPWEEPTDAFYLFRSNYAPKLTEPMVYIVSHTWPGRWSKPGLKDSIIVYSNCDEVELFNDVNGQSLGKKTKKGVGTHFQWDRVLINYNVLYAVGYVAGKAVAKDVMILHHLPQSPKFKALVKDEAITKPDQAYQYLYRLNCGGPDYTDQYGNFWSADQQLTAPDRYGSISWASNFPGVPAFFASQRRTFSPIVNTSDGKLFQSFRYGRDQLHFKFPIPETGEYLIELYFIEPWLGVGGGVNAAQMRLFDVAVNNRIMIKDLDIWKEAGTNAVLKKSITILCKKGQLDISFPNVKVGQALISAIAVASRQKNVKVKRQQDELVDLQSDKNYTLQHWMDIGDVQFSDQSGQFMTLPPNLYGATWIRSEVKNEQQLKFKLLQQADVFVALSTLPAGSWLDGFEATKTSILNSSGERFRIYRKRIQGGEEVVLGDPDRSEGYTVAILPPSELEPAYDLKTITSYKAMNALFTSAHLLKEEFLGKERVVFKTASEDKLTFPIAVGVADVYALTLKYHNPADTDAKGKIEFFAADGTLMKTENVIFSATKAGKWNYLSANTGSMVNAGNYRVSVTLTEGKNLYVDQLDVQ